MGSIVSSVLCNDITEVMNITMSAVKNVDSDKIIFNIQGTIR